MQNLSIFADGSIILLTIKCFDTMELIDLLAKLKHLNYAQKKYHVDRHGEYVQLVFASKHFPAWMESIAALLGAPVKTADQPVTADVIALTEDFGEIFDHQTLYYCEIDHHRIMAMFWPWSNQESITLKIMILKEDIG
jgi:hypothetical protein